MGRVLRLVVVLAVALAPLAVAPGASAGAAARPVLGPLVVSRENPRYFTVAGPAGRHRVVYLTGSHIWNNLEDGLGPGSACAQTPERNDYGAYLDFLGDHGQNFIRLWRWENFVSQAAGADFHLCMSPQPWPRTGPGAASDGKPRFDLSRFDPAYFSRLRERIEAAGERGIYVSVMLFDGFCLQNCQPADAVAGHPFAAGNNVNGIGITSLKDYEVLPLDGRVAALQRAYIRQVIDTVHDLPNVLFEVANESSGDPTNARLGDSTGWQYGVIDYVKDYEAARGWMAHPVGMTMQFPVPDQSTVNDALYASPADWISPGFDDVYFTGRWLTNPPANDGRKVVLSDTDHYAAGIGDALWAWKTFLRGNQPLLMDFGIIDVVHPLDPSLGVPSYASFEPARFAMGDTRRWAGRIDLAAVTPRGDLTSTTFALADPGSAYLVLQPAPGSFTVSLTPGTYAASWYEVTTRQTTRAARVHVPTTGPVSFSSPFTPTDPAVLYLKHVGR